MDLPFPADPGLLSRANPWVSEDGQGNSCVTVDATGAVLMRRPGTNAAAPGPLHARAALASPDWLRDGVIDQLSVPTFGGDVDGVRGHRDDDERIPVLANLAAAALAIDTELPRATPLYADGWDTAAATLAPHGWLIAACGT